MNSIKKYLNSLGRTSRTAVLALAVVFVSAGIAQAATTIGLNVQTDGTLSATGQTTLGQASSTILSVFGPSYFGATATSTFDTAGNLSLIGTLGVTGVTSLTSATTSGAVLVGGNYLSVGGYATTTQAGNISTNGTLSVTGATSLTSATTSGAVAVNGNYLAVGGYATTTQAGNISTRGSLTVGTSGNAVSNIIAGYCVATVTFSALNTASSTQTYANCTPYTSAGVAITSLTAGTGSGSSRVFMQATSSLPYYVILQSASTTGASTINVSLVNTSTSTLPAASSIYTFNFWSFQ